MSEYNFKDIESKWQQKWEQNNIFKTLDKKLPVN